MNQPLANAGGFFMEAGPDRSNPWVSRWLSCSLSSPL